MNIFIKKTTTFILVIILVMPLGLDVFIPTTHADHGERHGPDDGLRNSPSEDAHEQIEGVKVGGGEIAATAGSVLTCLGGGLIQGALIGFGAASLGAVVPTNDAAVTTNTGTEVNKECVLDGLAVVLREVLISNMTRSIVNWINGGFNGEPAFITDLEGFMTNVGDEVIGSFIEADGNLAFLCSPFRADVRIALALDYYSKERVSCTLSEVLDNIEDAFEDLPSGDAWNQWYELSVNPHNNAVGSFLSARNSVRLEKAKAQDVVKQVLGWGDGFQSYEVCDNEGIKKEDTTAPVLSGRINNAGFNCRISTPGKIINETLSDTLQTGSRQLELADEINEIIGALLGQLTNQIFGGSQNGLSGLSRSSSGRQSYLNQVVQESRDKAESEFRDYGISTMDGSISTENQFISAKKVSLARLNVSENLLKSLHQCYADKLSVTQSIGLTSEQRAIAIERMNVASSTITASLTPLQNLLPNEIKQAEDNISKLLVIKENLKNASSQAGIERILTNEFDPLVENRIIHLQPDLTIAQQQRIDIGDITDAMDKSTTANISTCNAFPPNTGGNN